MVFQCGSLLRDGKRDTEIVRPDNDGEYAIPKRELEIAYSEEPSNHPYSARE